jgi:hypothetical protein
MLELPIRGLWMPDEIVVMQTAYAIILRKHRHDASFEKHPQEELAESLVTSARDECHDVRALVRRCEADLATRH